jgi:hypothetical protein
VKSHPAIGAMERLEGDPSLDHAVRVLDRVVPAVLGTGRRKGFFEGRWLGHTFHALLTDFVEGPWMAATFLDLFGPPGSAASARRLLGLGLAVVPLAHLSGLADWQQAEHEGARRGGPCPDRVGGDRSLCRLLPGSPTQPPGPSDGSGPGGRRHRLRRRIPRRAPIPRPRGGGRRAGVTGRRPGPTGRIRYSTG